ncbi:MAG: hypothetical protein WAO41_06025 [Candidatus Nanopelagicales bacterium]
MSQAQPQPTITATGEPISPKSLGIWALIDFVMIVVGSFRDAEGRVLANWS